MSRLPLTPEQAELAQRIYQTLHQVADADLRDLAELLASKPDRQLLGPTRIRGPRPCPPDRRQGPSDRPGGAEKRGYQGSSLSCPHCHESARFVEYRPKLVQSLIGTFPLERAYYHCRSCGAGTVSWDDTLRTVLGERFRRGQLEKARAGHGITGQAPTAIATSPPAMASRRIWRSRRPRPRWSGCSTAG